ncbi:MAG TPA: MltA domain-containing protein [Candidatus Saccharimonadales bacterium]|nr:MltA domain-containing protein [Candidatus Saccharimonadales bacterium]
MLLRFKSVCRQLFLLGLLLFCGCAPALKTAPPLAEFNLANFRDDRDLDSLRAAIVESKSYLAKLPPDRVVGEQPRRLTANEVLASLLAFEQLLDQWACAPCLARELRARFELVPSSADPRLAEILFTGYYQPVIEGSPVPTAEYRYPVYGKPTDLVTAEQVTVGPAMKVETVFGRVESEQFTPYYTRREIDQLGALRGRGLELAWVKDPVDLFFLQIQGSGIIRFPDGAQRGVGYTAQNGLPYRSIGRWLIDKGKLSKDEMSMQRLRRYLAEHPSERDEIFAYNESYVFFRELRDGPLGSLGVPVTAGRSVATDSRLFPKGALALIQTRIPIVDDSGQLNDWLPIARFVLNQDTGGAIRGLQRADIYFGSGDHAAGLAGYMNSPGKIFFLLLKKADESMNPEWSRSR